MDVKIFYSSDSGFPTFEVFYGDKYVGNIYTVDGKPGLYFTGEFTFVEQVMILGAVWKMVEEKPLERENYPFDSLTW